MNWSRLLRDGKKHYYLKMWFMGQKDTPVSSKANLVISLVVAAVAVGFFAFGSNKSRTNEPPATAAHTTPPRNAATSNQLSAPSQTTGQPGAGVAVPSAVANPGTASQAAGQVLSHPVPYEVVPAQPALSAEAASSLAAELNLQVQGEPNELPEDLKAQLHAAPPELPEDLRKQLNAPPPEIPEDIKAQMAIPPRRVSIDEVNDPNFIQKQDEAKAP